MNICSICMCAHRCRLDDPERCVCPIFGENPPQDPPEYEQLKLPIEEKGHNETLCIHHDESV